MTRGSFVTPSIQRLWSRPLRWVQSKQCRLSVLAGRELCSFEAVKRLFFFFSSTKTRNSSVVFDGKVTQLSEGQD